VHDDGIRCGYLCKIDARDQDASYEATCATGGLLSQRERNQVTRCKQCVQERRTARNLGVDRFENGE